MGFIADFLFFFLWYPLVICYIAIENGPFIVDLPIKNGDCPYLSWFITLITWTYGRYVELVNGVRNQQT